MTVTGLDIVVPTYNRAHLLRALLDPLLMASEEMPVQVIVVDDASSDTTEAQLATLAQRFPRRLQYYRLPTNSGATAARNRGLELGKYPFVQFIDSDDTVVLPRVLQLMQVLANDPNLDFVYGTVQKRQGSRLLGQAIGADYADCPKSCIGYHWHTMGALYRREFIEHVKWNEDLRGSDDWELQARIKLETKRRRFVPALLGYWNQHDGPRMGTSSFNKHYVLSTVNACFSIAAAARQRMLLDNELADRLFYRILFHACELEADGHSEDARSILARSTASLARSTIIGRTLTALAEDARLRAYAFSAMRGRYHMGRALANILQRKA